MLFNFFNKKVNVWRLVDDIADDTETYQEHLTNINCLIYPLEEGYGQDLDGVYGKDFIMVCDVYDIKEKDKIFDDDGFQYIVTGQRDYEFHYMTLMELRIKQMPQAEDLESYGS